MSNARFNTGALIALYLILGGVALTHAAPDDTKRDKPTEEDLEQDKVILVAKQFLKGIEDKDVDQLMKLADVPWLGNDEKVIKDRKVLEKSLREFLEKTDVRQVGLKFNGLLPIADWSKFKSSTENSKMLFKATAGETGYVVWLRNDKSANRYLLARLDGEQVKIVSAPYRQTYLIVKREEIPDLANEFLNKAEELTLFSLHPDYWNDPPKNNFHGHEILGQTAIKDKDTLKKLIASFRKGHEENEGEAAKCFLPHHGIRIVRDGKTVDFVVCFTCFQVCVYVDGKEGGRFLISRSPQAMFDKVLRDAKVLLDSDRKK